MANTIARLEAQIAQLKRQADALRAKERMGVIERINVAIKHYELTPADLNFSTNGFTKRTKQAPSSKSKSGRGRAKKPVGAIRFRDENGNSWTGHGRAPLWYKEALAAGKTRENLAVSS